jgi:hypothetical protein
MMVQKGWFMRVPIRQTSTGWEWLVILAVLGALISGVPALFAWPAERILFAPGVYKQVLLEQGVYEKYPAWLGQLIAQGGGLLIPGSDRKLDTLLESSRFQELLGEVFPQAWMRQQAESLVDQFWAFFNLKEDTLRLVVDFRGVKTNLSGPAAAQIASAIVTGLPPCTEQELLDFGLKSLSGQSAELPLCRPPQQLVGMANLLVGGLLQGMAGTLPDQADLAVLAQGMDGPGGKPLQEVWGSWFGLYRIFRLVLPWTAWIALACLGATALLGLLTYRGAFFWVGIAVLLPGLTALVTALLGGVLGSQVAPLLVQRLFGDMVVTSVLVQLTGEVIRRFSTASAVFALLVTLLGVMLIAGSIILKFSRRR